MDAEWRTTSQDASAKAGKVQLYWHSTMQTLKELVIAGGAA